MYVGHTKVPESLEFSGLSLEACAIKLDLFLVGFGYSVHF